MQVYLDLVNNGTPSIPSTTHQCCTVAKQQESMLRGVSNPVAGLTRQSLHFTCTLHCTPVLSKPNIFEQIGIFAMAKDEDRDVEMEDEYDEDADSDFEAASAASEEGTSSSDDENVATAAPSARQTKKRQTIKPVKPPLIEELDSGDEATIKEHHKTRRKQRQKGDDHNDGAGSGEDDPGWRAKTRSMRQRDQDEKKRNKLASTKASTIDVNKLWEEMNNPDFIARGLVLSQSGETDPSVAVASQLEMTAEKENAPTLDDMITIKRTYKFAGETHTEEKTVPKSSAEAQLWLAQQAVKPQVLDAEGRVVQRPMRRVSRFDPNVHDLESFKGNWAAQAKTAKGPKLNVVEKSKMDWASHVDAEGLKDELDTHAKAKEGYMHRMDFLREVEQRKEEEARAARSHGR
jgi:hypothetical protein